MPPAPAAGLALIIDAGHRAARRPKPQPPADQPSNGRPAMVSAVWYALAAGAWVIFAAWPEFWSAPAGLLQGGLIGYAPATAWADGDNQACAEYHWHGLQFLAGNREFFAGPVLLVTALRNSGGRAGGKTSAGSPSLRCERAEGRWVRVDCGGVVLAGGRSSRMGTPKAALEWRGSTLLRRTVGIVARATGGPVVVVRASGQELPALPGTVILVDDPREGKGPLQGIAAGLAALVGEAETAFVTSTDLPFLHPAYISRVLSARSGPAGPDIALPVARGYQQPLAAAYRTGLAGLAERLVKEDRLRPAFLFAECTVERLDDAALLADPVLAALDPDLDSVLNVNTPDDYQAARRRPAPVVTVHLSSALAAGLPDGPPDVREAMAHAAPDRPATVRAATVRAAAAAVGLRFGRHVTAVINDHQVTRDGSEPLAVGDNVSFRPAGGAGHVAFRQ
jgi:molybdopterin-guanine dinucleotide biosynthesis protein A